MLDSLFRRKLRLHNFPYSLVVYCSIGVLLGVAFLLLPLMWTFTALVSVGLAVSAIKRPELLPLAFLVLTSTVITIRQAPSFSSGFGTLYLTDVVFLLSLGFITLRLISKPDFKIVRTPLDWPLLIFWGASLMSTIIAISGSSLPWKESLHEIRTVTSYLMFFAVTNLVCDKRQITFLTKGVILLGTIVAMVMIAQYFFGHSMQFILAGRIEDMTVESDQIIAGVTRIIPPGQSIIMVAFAAGFAIFVLEKASALRFFQCGVLVLAIVLTFFRATWVITGFTMLIIGLLARGRERKRLIVSCLVVALLGTIILMAVQSQPESRGAGLTRAVLERAFTLFKSGTFEDPDSSLRWRDFEYSYALPHILSNPFVGLGLGASYRPFTEKDHEDFDGRTFIHNGHVWVLLKSGIFGYIGLLWFMLSFLLRGFRYWRRILDPYMRGIVLAFALTSIGVLIISIVEPYFMTSSWAPVIGIIAGINEVILRRFSPGPSEIR